MATAVNKTCTRNDNIVEVFVFFLLLASGLALRPSFSARVPSALCLVRVLQVLAAYQFEEGHRSGKRASKGSDAPSEGRGLGGGLGKIGRRERGEEVEGDDDEEEEGEFQEGGMTVDAEGLLIASAADVRDLVLDQRGAGQKSAFSGEGEGGGGGAGEGAGKAVTPSVRYDDDGYGYGCDL